MADAVIKQVLQNVRVCKADALDVEKKFKEESFDALHERCEIMRAFNIPMSKLSEFLDYMGEAYEGIDEEEIKQLKGIKFSKLQTHHFLDFNYVKSNDDDMNRLRYGMVVLAKSGDQLGCMYVLYKMDFKIAKPPTNMLSILWGFFRWEVSNPSKIAGVVQSPLFQNFFRKKAIEEFHKEGIIDSINYV